MELKGFVVDSISIDNPALAHFGGQIEQQREVGHQTVRCEVAICSRNARIEAPANALINDGRIDESIAQNDVPCAERRAYDGRDMLGSISQKQE